MKTFLSLLVYLQISLKLITKLKYLFPKKISNVWERKIQISRKQTFKKEYPYLD